MDGRRCSLYGLSLTFLHGSTATRLRKTETCRWTASHEESLRTLLQGHKYDGDLMLVSLLREQRIFEQVMLSPYAARFTGLNFDSVWDEGDLPPAAFIRALEAQQQQIEQDLPPALRNTGQYALELK
jgi:hypothetical protein